MDEALKLNQIHSFVAVVESGSFTRGAERSGLSKALVSLHLKQLEAGLGVALLSRSTRSLSLTEAGARFYQDCQQILNATQQAVDRVRQDQASLQGSLRISASAGYGASTIVPALARFSRQHPAVSIDYLGADEYSDLVADGLDLAIRIGPGLENNDYKARKIDQFQLIVVAAPALLQSHPAPKTPQDLLRFPWVSRPPSQAVPLTFLHPKQKAQVLRPAASIRANQYFALQSFVEAGVGLAALPPRLVASALREGRLCQLLPDYQLPVYEVYAVYPNTRHPSSKVRTLIDFLVEDIARQS
jgi:DNA-binding transcriptional LysR family regulator